MVISKKLYELSVIPNSTTMARPLSYSQDMDKLAKSVYLGKNRYWSIFSSQSSQIVKRQSGDFEDLKSYPIYQIREVNFII